MPVWTKQTKASSRLIAERDRTDICTVCVYTVQLLCHSKIFFFVVHVCQATRTNNLLLLSALFAYVSIRTIYVYTLDMPHGHLHIRTHSLFLGLSSKNILYKIPPSTATNLHRTADKIIPQKMHTHVRNRWPEGKNSTKIGQADEKHTAAHAK